jgi:hypothetical protein
MRLRATRRERRGEPASGPEGALARRENRRNGETASGPEGALARRENRRTGDRETRR